MYKQAIINQKIYNIFQYSINKNVPEILTITLYSLDKIDFQLNTFNSIIIDDIDLKNLYLFSLDFVEENNINKYILYGEEK